MNVSQIMEQFEGFTEGYRMLILLERSKDGGNNKDRHALKRTTTNKEEFETVLTEFWNLQNTTHQNYRIYSCVNSRNINKAIRIFKQLQLDADYFDEKSKNEFYLDIRNRWFSAYMQPQTKEESNFLFDIDTKDATELKAFEEKLVKVTRNYRKFETKNGWHYVTTPFNPALMEGYKINKDGLLLLNYLS